MQAEQWCGIGADEALARLGSREAGLSAAEAAERLRLHGPNVIAGARQVRALSILVAQFRNALVLILLGATVLSGLLGHAVESVVIAVIVLFAVLLGFVQEYRAERALAALRDMAAPEATVVRDGVDARVPAASVVPGDLILLGAGDRVPADARLLVAVGLALEEAALTGESAAVAKCTEALAEAATVGDRRNMVFAGTSVCSGRGCAVVVGTGMDTEFGRIAGMLAGVAPGPTPLQRNLDRLGSVLGRVAAVVIALIAVSGWLRGHPLLEMLLFGIALAVAVVPEALPAVVTISLAIGVQKMVRRHALVRRLQAVETLGSTSVILTDKTGTLTCDEMTVREIWCAGRALHVSGAGYVPDGGFTDADGQQVQPDTALRALLEAAALACDARLLRTEDGDWQLRGDPTEGALLVAAAKAGFHRQEMDLRAVRVAEFPFCAETKRMLVVVRAEDGLLACAKGAPEVILAACDRTLGAGGVVALDTATRARILEAAQSMAGRALRVLAVASRSVEDVEAAQDGLVFLGLAGMIDPPRPEAGPAIARCRQAGVRVAMITGDHPLTARAVAMELGLAGPDAPVLVGADIERMTAPELERRVGDTLVFARVSPAHKLRVVEAWQARGAVVAMTGDGVNDAPALRQADVGIAMGVSGTDVSREAAAMTLTDDNFASIVAAVEEGRGVFANIHKYLVYLLSANVGEIGLMAGTMLLGLPLPLVAVQILYVNLATQGLPALALAVDPPAEDLMRRPPRDPRKGIFSREVMGLMLLGGAWEMLVNLAVFVWAYNGDGGLAHAMTMCFLSLVLIQFVKAYGFRSERVSLFRSTFSNRWLNLAVAWEMAMLLLVLNLPLLQGAFRLVPLAPADWAVAVAGALSIVPVLEFGKAVIRRRAA